MKSPSAVSVFEKYAHEYDLMTNSAQREKLHRREVSALIDRFNPSSVLDAGCATGLTTSLFAKRGVATVGLDRSKAMLKLARAKFSDFGDKLSFRYGNFEKLPKVLAGRFDLVVCLANSISGVGTVGELNRSLRNFRSVLKNGGYLVLQMLNYEGWNEGEMRPIRATGNEGITYLRFSERQGTKFFLHIIRLDQRQAEPQFEVFRHEFDNFSATQMMKQLKLAGFVRIERYSNLLMTEKFVKSSRDLVLVAKR